TNNAAVAIYQERLPHGEAVSVAQWMLACVPIGAVYLALAWFVLTRHLPKVTSSDESLRTELRNRLTRLGRPTTAEVRMMLVFAATAVLWVFRRKIVMGSVPLLPGWSDLTDDWFRLLGMSEKMDAETISSFINDSTVSMLMAVAMFVIPSGTRTPAGRNIPLMDWNCAVRLPWDIMLLFGGGFALAKAFDTTQLSEWLGAALTNPLAAMPPWLVICVVCTMMTFLTEFTSNVATISTLMPTLCAMSVALQMDARLLFIPATLATSCAFMLPIATPPNAIVFGAGRLNVGQMVRYGFLLNIAGIPILLAGTYLLVKPILGIP
ncbi:MAG: anion permease, partial [Planctomycetaceae bacterium]|nr:anion permease [Planctomycetaceae bacterium]